MSTFEPKVRYIDDQIIVTTNSVWVAYEVPTLGVGYRTARFMESVATQQALGLAALTSGEFRLTSTYEPHPVAQWARQLDTRVAAEALPSWPDRLVATQRHLAGQSPWKARSFILFELAQRPSWAAFQAVTPDWKTLPSWLRRQHRPSDAELAEHHETARQLTHVMALSGLRARPAGARGVEFLFRSHTSPGLASPIIEDSKYAEWDHETVKSLVDNDVTPGYRMVRVDSEEGRSYAATLCLTRQPGSWDFPGTPAWLHYRNLLPFPVRCDIVGELRPSDKVQSDVRRKLEAARDERNHARRAGQDPPPAIEETLDIARELEASLPKDHLPFAYARARFRVAASTEEECRRRTEAVKAHYGRLMAGYDVRAPGGDQWDLYTEGWPGEPVRATGYRQRWPLVAIGAGLPTASADLGDAVGPYLGQTTGSARTMVNLDLWYAPRVLNRPGGCAIIGESGWGKSVTASKLVVDAIESGAYGVVIDPSGPLARLAQLPRLRDYTEVLDLEDAPDGALDPFHIIEMPHQSLKAAITKEGKREIARVRGQQRALARELVRLLLPHDAAFTWLHAVNKAIKVVSHEPNPSMSKVLGKLQANPDLVAQAAYEWLDDLADLPYSRLILGAAERQSVKTSLDRRLLILVARGLALPESGTTREDFAHEEQVGIAVLHATMVLARSMLHRLPNHVRKLLMLDEARVISMTAFGRRFIVKEALDGRKRMMALLLVSQNVAHLTDEQVVGALSTIIAGRSRSTAEQLKLLTLLRIEDEPAYREVLVNLLDGEGLMRDANDRIDTIQTDLDGDAELQDASYTTPGSATIYYSEAAA